jgi:hypothetical protein
MRQQLNFWPACTTILPPTERVGGEREQHRISPTPHFRA